MIFLEDLDQLYTFLKTNPTFPPAGSLTTAHQFLRFEERRLTIPMKQGNEAFDVEYFSIKQQPLLPERQGAVVRFVM